MARSDETPSMMVTGADRGIGLGLVRHYLEQGCTVIATTRRDTPGQALSALADRHDRLRVLSLDCSNETSINAFGKRLVAENVTLDVAINNAAISLDEPYGQWTAEHFATHLMVNTIAPALLVQAMQPVLQPGSIVIQMSSGMASAEYNVNADGPLDAYAASKSALNLLTRRLAEKLRPQAIAVVAMSPGWVQTEMGGEGATDTVEEAVQKMTGTIAKLGMDDTGRFIGPEGKPLAW
ncbi:MAG: SDR family oxidoreductase [Planctomycetota bacterium]